MIHSCFVPIPPYLLFLTIMESSRNENANAIYIHGAQEQNLRNISVTIPRGKLTVITGVSGSGKSSLAFDTLYAEGYRKYLDALSPRIRQLLAQIPKPNVDYIKGLSPVIAIEQKSSRGYSPHSLVATATELADYARLLWATGGTPYNPNNGSQIIQRSLDDCIAKIYSYPANRRLILLAPHITARPTALREACATLKQKGYQRIRIDGIIKRLDQTGLIPNGREKHTVEIVIDRLTITPQQRTRLADSLELAFQEGNHQALVLVEKKGGGWTETPISQNLVCQQTGKVFEKLTPQHFSFTHPLGACPQCQGKGTQWLFKEELIIPNPDISIAKGAIKAWQIGSKTTLRNRKTLLKQLAQQLPFSITSPWKELPLETKKTILYGNKERLFSFKTPTQKAPQTVPFKGVIADLEYQSLQPASQVVQAQLIPFQASSTCPHCQGSRLAPYPSACRFHGKTFPEWIEMNLQQAKKFIVDVQKKTDPQHPLYEPIEALQHRLRFLNEVGLSYLPLNRTMSSLSGGESQRVKLATQLGMGLVGVIYVLDEPSIGLHPHDHQRLIEQLRTLQKNQNTVVVVEHDPDMIREADYLIELGKGAGKQGGDLLFQGSLQTLPKATKSLIKDYLAGQSTVKHPSKTLNRFTAFIEIQGADAHNLKNIDARIPVGGLTVVCGVSGSGKSTLINDILGKTAANQLNRAKEIPASHQGIHGLQSFESLIRVDQSPIGKSPRSNPATYTKLFDLLRNLLAQTPLAKVRGYPPARFSFNVTGGRCERCKGEGQIKLDMQFMADAFVPCPSCQGQRYNRETLEVRFRGKNISEILSMTVQEAISLFEKQPQIFQKLKILDEVGLGYIPIGQAANTLSGGEAQRIKLALELSKRSTGKSLYLLDEPTTGLNWIDTQKLFELLFRLRDAGNTIVVIEHNIEVIKLADWICELGPYGGYQGGNLLYNGPREKIEKCKESLILNYL